MVMPKVIATDLDGTLFYPKKRIMLIPKDSKKFLRRFIDDGGKLLVVSGRGKFFADKVAKSLDRPVDAIACNGSLIIDNGEIVKETFFSIEELKTVLNQIRREHKLMFISLFCKNCNFVIDVSMMKLFPRIGYRLYEVYQGCYHERVFKSEKVYYEQLEKGEVYKVLLFVGPWKKYIQKSEELTDLLSIRYPNLNFAASNQAIEVTPKGVTKSSGIAFYLEKNKISKDNILVVGDSGNDISMFDGYYDNSYCMSHAPKRVQSHAKFLIDHFSDLEKYVYPSEESINPKTTIEVEERTKKQ